jgi:hypothetical protein
MTLEHNNKMHNNLTFDEKLVKLLEHWIKHNDDHAENYKDWAKKTKEKGMNDVGLQLEDAVDMTELISNKFKKALELIKNQVFIQFLPLVFVL